MEIKVNRKAKTPVYMQIVSQLKAKIIVRELGAGDVLPSERHMALRLGVHRNTVTKAYKELESLGFIESRQGYGYTISLRGDEEQVDRARGAVNWPSMIHEDYMRGQRKFDDLWSKSYNRKIYSFAVGTATSGIFKSADITSAIEKTVESGKRGENFFTPYQGDLDLRKEIVKFMRDKGVEISTSNVQVFSQLNQALDFIFTLMLKPGDTVITEEPLNPDIFRAFELAGVRQIGVPMDWDGMFTDNLEMMIEKYHPKFIYVSSSYHDPTGAVLSYKRRQKLLNLSYEYRVPIIEDDASSLLDYDYVSSSPLRALDHGENVIYLYSFEMTFVPGLNLTFVIAPKQVIKSLSYLVAMRVIGIDAIPQKTLAYFMKTGLYYQGVSDMKKINSQKKALMYSYIQNAGIEDFRAKEAMGGVYLWCHVPESINIKELLKRAEKKGVVFMPGYLFYPRGKQPNNYIRLCFSTPNEMEIKKGMPILIEIIREMLEENR